MTKYNYLGGESISGRKSDKGGRTSCGAYSEESFGDRGKDKIRNVTWGPYEGSPPPILDVSGRLDAADYEAIERDGFSGPVRSGPGKVQRRRWW
jgi:hypothetical protein